jgi:hypothetical protein
VTGAARFPTLLDGLAAALIEAADAFDKGVHWRAAVLWPDPERQFSPLFARLRAGLAARSLALYRLGPYDPAGGTGPAIWLRCLLDATLPASPPPGHVPVFLLPDLSLRDLKSPQTLDRLTRPLAELHYRGAIFHNRRQTRDWTAGTFLRSPEQGLGLDVAADARTDQAAAAALAALLDYPLADLPARRLLPEDFLRLNEPDEVRSLLDWIADPAASRAARAATWSSVAALIQATFSLDPDAKGARQIALERLAKGEGVWRAVLARVDDAPEQHRAVCEALRAAEGAQFGLPGLSEPAPGSSADNDIEERRLAPELQKIADLPHQDAIARVLALEEEHAPRRKTRWGRLGDAPLAGALEPLARLARAVREPLPGADLVGLAQSYADTGYAADNALIDALACAGPHAALIGKAARALYWPWVDPLAARFRAALEAGGDAAKARPIRVAPGTCVLFVDGLRFDIGRRLHDLLAQTEPVALSWRLAPIPTVTASAKPVATPVADAIAGAGRADLFLPLETSSGKPADTACLVAAMRARGVEVLGPGESRGPPSAQAIGWSECGHLDRDGHAMGERLAGHIEAEIEAIAHRVLALRRAGWAQVRVVTDHGWLLIPGGLPKAAIAASTLRVTAWSRVALLADGAAPEAPTLPWTFDPAMRIAVPPGAHAFRAGEAYAHGGVSLQECVVPDLLVGDALAGDAAAVGPARIAALSWKRYRLTVTLDRDAAGLDVDIRRDPRDPTSAIASERLGAAGARVDLRVDGDIDEETPVFVVLFDAHGSVLDAKATAIGVN